MNLEFAVVVATGNFGTIRHRGGRINKLEAIEAELARTGAPEALVQ
ncbi:MAG: hypothetical protein KGJ55_00890 [Gammaproteobacteria bacterium]|nr:hypothetical protein [Gammaproteobacteria bacterium]